MMGAAQRASLLVFIVTECVGPRRRASGRGCVEQVARGRPLYGYSLLIDPARAWQPEIGPFVEGGDPVGDFEQSCRRVQVPIATFPFTANGFIVHLVRAPRSFERLLRLGQGPPWTALPAGFWSAGEVLSAARGVWWGGSWSGAGATGERVSQEV